LLSFLTSNLGCVILAMVDEIHDWRDTEHGYEVCLLWFTCNFK
jgi:hypothetical protein